MLEFRCRCVIHTIVIGTKKQLPWWQYIYDYTDVGTIAVGGGIRMRRPIGLTRQYSCCISTYIITSLYVTLAFAGECAIKCGKIDFEIFFEQNFLSCFSLI